MKIVKPSFQIIKQETGVNGIFKHIELAGRTCYRSEDKITQNSAKEFVDRMIKSSHHAMLEHGTVYLKVIKDDYHDEKLVGTKVISRYLNNKYSKVNVDYDYAYITSNFRVLIENNWLNDLQYLCEPTEKHEKRVTILFHTQIAISREFNRHRVNSVAESSTRYCNYSRDKFGSEITVNLPSWIDPIQIASEHVEDFNIKAMLLKLAEIWGNVKFQLPKSFSAIEYWLLANVVAEYCYMGLIENGWTAQQARTILPLDTNTDLVHTAFISDWQHFFDLRAVGTTGKPHPDAMALAVPLYEEFKRQHLID